MSNFEDVTHPQMVHALVKPGQDVVDEMTPMKANIMHMAVGISGEAGELLDAIKKHVFYNKPLDMVNVIEELGDLEFYMEGLRQEVEVMRLTTLKMNKEKLSKRYHSLTYSDQHAQERKDKA